MITANCLTQLWENSGDITLITRKTGLPNQVGQSLRMGSSLLLTHVEEKDRGTRGRLKI